MELRDVVVMGVGQPSSRAKTRTVDLMWGLPLLVGLLTISRRTDEKVSLVTPINNAAKCNDTAPTWVNIKHLLPD